MPYKVRSSLLSLAIIAVLVFGAISPTIVHADEGTPPDPPPTEVSSACTADGDCPSSEEAATTSDDSAVVTTEETSVPTEAAVEATDVPTEVAAEATAVPTEAPAEATSASEALATEVVSEEATAPPATEEAAPVVEEVTPAPDTTVLDQVPADTTVTVLDTQGEVQPLATQEAADAIATSDPIWCPQGQSPTPGANGCTDSFTSFNALLTFLSGNATYQGAGTIYIQQGTYTGGGSSIDFNSPTYDLSNIRNSDLTLTGGWDTTTNVVDPAGTSSFRIPIRIGTSANPWGGSVTINNITIDKSNGTSLSIYSQNEIVLSNVNISNAHSNGAGAELNAGGDVTIANSNFLRNKVAGAIIRSKGNVAIVNSTFNNPVSGRAQIEGLNIVTDGSVALLNVSAVGNRQAGATIDAGGRVSINTAFFTGTKSFVGTGPSSGFQGYGLQIVTQDAIDLASVTASDNFLWGASLQAGGDVTIADSIFNANTTESPHFIDDTGLLITSGGSVALNNVQANDNRLIGAKIDAVKDVAINNSSFSSNNGITLSSTGGQTFHGYGLQVTTLGNIAVNMTTASDNALFGAHLDAGGDVAVSNSNFNNQISDPTVTDPTQQGRGLEIISGGNVFLSNVFVDNNQTFGANIQAGGDIYLDTVTATNNALNGVDVKGACTTVFLINGNYANNGGYGLSIVNALLNQSGAPAFTGNGAGDIFQDPGSCTFPPPAPPLTGTTQTGNGSIPGSVTSSPSSPVQTTLQVNPVQIALQQTTSFGYSGIRGGFVPATGVTSEELTLNSFATNLRTTSQGVHLSIFTGNYAYVYSDSGEFYIIALSPSANELAMDGS